MIVRTNSQKCCDYSFVSNTAIIHKNLKRGHNFYTILTGTVPFSVSMSSDFTILSTFASVFSVLCLPDFFVSEEPPEILLHINSIHIFNY